MFLLHGLKKPDIIFFVVCGIVIVLIVVIYFLIPVIKHKQLEEARENLRKRDALFRQNQKEELPKKVTVEAVAPEAENTEEVTPVNTEQEQVAQNE